MKCFVSPLALAILLLYPNVTKIALLVKERKRDLNICFLRASLSSQLKPMFVDESTKFCVDLMKLQLTPTHMG